MQRHELAIEHDITEPSLDRRGIVLTRLSIVVMPWLAHAKRKAGRAMNSRLVIADAAETCRLDLDRPDRRVCYRHLRLQKGKEAWEGEPVCDDDD